MYTYVFAMTTVGSEEDASRLAKELVERNVIACANIIPGIRSFYHWQGRLCDDKEFFITMKTRDDKVEAIKQILSKIHPYDEPELIFLPIKDGSKTYLEWIDDSLKGSSQVNTKF